MEKWSESEAIRYPVSMIDGGELLDFLRSRNRLDSTREDDLQALANFILRRACDQGEIIPRRAFDALCAARNARDMDVAKEVVKSLCWVLEPAHPERFNEDYLLPVIARANK